METKTTEPVTERRLKDLVNTPFKKVMLVLQITSYFLIVGSPVIGGAIGKILHLKAGKTAGVILAVFIIGEVLFYGTLLFLGKEVVLLIRTKIKKRFRRKSAN